MKYYLGFLVWVFALTIALCVDNHAFGQTAPTVSQWEQTNDNCQGEPTLRSNGKDNPACRKRDSIAMALIRQGWLPCNHGVWVSPTGQAQFAQILNRTNGLVSEDMRNADYLVPTMLADLRRYLQDDQIFALWNEQRPAIQAYAPFGSVVLVGVMQRLMKQYERSHDVRFYVEP